MSIYLQIISILTNYKNYLTIFFQSSSTFDAYIYLS